MNAPGGRLNADPQAIQLTPQTVVLMRQFFVAFLPWVFAVLHPGQGPLRMSWYLQAMCEAFHKVATGKSKRLVINVPPRHLKSITSVAFVAWILGRDPALSIMLTTYGAKLSREHLDKLARIMAHPLYRQLFPQTELVPGGLSDQVLSTTAGGGCRCVTVGGATTGMGADIIIIDDAMKAEDIVSEARREELDLFYSGTLVTRINNKQAGAIISIQQRLGLDDLPGRLIDAGADHLCLPAWSDTETIIDLGFGRIYRRPPGELLRPEDEPRHVLEQYRREMGPASFATQYLQLPYALEGNVIRTEQFQRFDLAKFPRRRFFKIVQSWDTATSEDPRGDYSVCMTFGYRNRIWYLIDVIRFHGGFANLRDRLVAQQLLWKADRVLVEDAGAGSHICQDLSARGDWRPLAIRPDADKVTRMVGQLALIEDGDIRLPNEAPWLDTLLKELRAFPAVQHDDQVDALSQFLAWSKRNENWSRTGHDPGTGRLIRPSREDRRRRPPFRPVGQTLDEDVQWDDDEG